MNNIENSISEILNLDKEEFFKKTIYLKDNCTRENIPALKSTLNRTTDEDKRFYLIKLIKHLDNCKSSVGFDSSGIDLKSSDISERLLGLKKIISTRDLDYADEVRELIKNESDAKIISVSISALKAVGNKSDASLLLPFLRHADDGIKAITIEALEVIGDHECLKYIIPLAESNNNLVRANCLKTLWRFGHGKVIEEISNLLNTTNQQLLNSIIYILGEIKSEKSREILDNLLDRDLDSKLHEKIKEKLIVRDDDFTFPEKFLNNVKVSYIRTKEDKFFFALTAGLVVLTVVAVLLFSNAQPVPAKKSRKQIIAECINKGKQFIENCEINKSINFLNEKNTVLKSREISEYLGNIMYEFQRYDKSKLYYFEVLNSTENPGEHLLNRIGEVCQQLGKSEEAIKYFEKAVKKNLNFYEANNNLGDAYFQLGNLNKAMDYFKKGEKSGGSQDPMLKNNIGFCYFKKGNNKMAYKYYLEALEIDNKHIETLNNMGLLQMKLGKFDKASVYLKKIIKTSPSDPIALDAARVLKIISSKLSRRKKN